MMGGTTAHAVMDGIRRKKEEGGKRGGWEGGKKKGERDRIMGGKKGAAIERGYQEKRCLFFS